MRSAHLWQKRETKLGDGTRNPSITTCYNTPTSKAKQGLSTLF